MTSTRTLSTIRLLLRSLLPLIVLGTGFIVTIVVPFSNGVGLALGCCVAVVAALLSGRRDNRRRPSPKHNTVLFPVAFAVMGLLVGCYVVRAERETAELTRRQHALEEECRVLKKEQREAIKGRQEAVRKSKDAEAAVKEAMADLNATQEELFMALSAAKRLRRRATAAQAATRAVQVEEQAARRAAERARTAEQAAHAAAKQLEYALKRERERMEILLERASVLQALD